jgi:hypothetical protein
MTKQIKGHSKNIARATKPGQRFNMDFGFLRGKEAQRVPGLPLATSKDGFNCYLTIPDEFSRFTWVFPFASKNPPIATITRFLKNHGLTHGNNVIRTDQGGELAGSIAFRKCVREANYVLETTGVDASFQNGIAERPHRTYADMMRTMLSGANLSSVYWSWALLHAVYVKNRIPHTALSADTTPFEQYTGRRPDLSNLKVFGCHVTVKTSGQRDYKIDPSNTTTGIYLGHPAASRNIIYEDKTTGWLHTARHILFDEAHFSSDNRPPYAQNLMEIAETDLAIKDMSHSLPMSPQPTTPVVPSKPVHGSLQQPLHIIPPYYDAVNTTHDSEFSDFEPSSNPFGLSYSLSLPVKVDHPTLGFN